MLIPHCSRVHGCNVAFKRSARSSLRSKNASPEEGAEETENESARYNKMKMRSSLKRALTRKIHVYCEHSTLHGAYYLPRGKSACFAWGAIMVAGVALWGALSHMIWHKYSTDPTVTVVESTYYRSDQIPFPAVMICDPIPVYGPKTKNVSHILSSRGYTLTEIDTFYSSFSDIQTTTYTPPAYIRKMHSILQDLGFNLDGLLEMFKKPCNVTLVTCLWRSKQYDCSEMFHEVTTAVGHCCHFDMGNFRKFVPEKTTLTSGITASEGLDVTLNGVKAYANGTEHAGPVHMYIFDSFNSVTMMDSPISLVAASYFDVDVEIFAIDSSPEVKALPLKTRKCVLATDRGIGASFYQKCIASLLMSKVVNYCRCVPFMYSAEDLSVEELPVCTWERYLCIIPQLEIAFADMHSLIRMNDCYQNCDYVEYDPKVEFMKKIRSGENDTTSKLSIHYASSTCLKYRREVIYTWDQMLANLGGIFGLCLGGSIISIIEIVWFLIDLLVTAMYSYKANPKQTQKTVAFAVEKFKKNVDKDEGRRYKFVN